MEKIVNIYMHHQEWVGYDPAQWVLVSSNRKMLFSANPPKWMDQQDEQGMAELENTMDRDKFVADRFECAMMVNSQELVDRMINSELAHLRVPDYEV